MTIDLNANLRTLSNRIVDLKEILLSLIGLYNGVVLKQLFLKALSRTLFKEVSPFISLNYDNNRFEISRTQINSKIKVINNVINIVYAIEKLNIKFCLERISF